MRTRAIIIKKQATREHDQLVTCYTEQFGKMTAVAKSVLKHSSTQSMQLEVGNLVDFELVSGKGTPIIAAAQTEDAYRNIKASLSHMAAASFFLEVIDVMAYENQEDPELWEFLAATFNDLNAAPFADLLGLLRQRQLALLGLMGYAPQVQRCALCGARETQQQWTLSLELGGIICHPCFMRGARGIALASADLRMLNGEEGAVVHGQSVVDAIFEYTAGKRIQSLSFFYQTFSRV
jgi:DNA repair protein RecO (recombination protein O)